MGDEMKNVIYALASGVPPAAIGVIRLSGEGVREIMEGMLGRTMPPPRVASLRLLRHGKNILDEALVLWMPAPRSYTGEDMAELHCHGGMATLAAVTDALEQMDNVRMAEAGEMTRRAFVNGKLDMTSVEGLADLMLAQTEAQRKQALQQWRGGGRKRIESWRRLLLGSLASYEAVIDFADEILPEDVLGNAHDQLKTTFQEIGAELERRDGERVREGIHIAIIGPPNAGKSTLLNALTGESVSITSSQAGTTRDVVRFQHQLRGHFLQFYDTAGLAVPQNELEAEGMRRARITMEKADYIWMVVAHDCNCNCDCNGNEDDVSMLPHDYPSERLLVLVNKSDDKKSLSFFRKMQKLCQKNNWSPPLKIAAREGKNLSHCYDWLFETMNHESSFTDPPIITRGRVRLILEETHAFLKSALDQARGEEELTAEYVRNAVQSLGRVTGHGGAEELLESLFKEFCIGK